jgi:hypothetical protein
MMEIVMENSTKQLSNLQQRVEEELQKHHSVIVLNYFQILCKKHNQIGKCDCEYCQKLPEYVAAKRYLQHLKKFNDDYLQPETIFESLEKQKLYVKKLKKVKDSLKLL